MRVNWITNKSSATSSIQSTTRIIPDRDGYHYIDDGKGNDYVVYVSNGVATIGTTEEEALDRYKSGFGDRIVDNSVYFD